MENSAAFGAEYVDLKVIKTRRVVQFIFEVPLEAADHALKCTGGMPDNEKSVWFAIAKMQKPDNAD